MQLASLQAVDRVYVWLNYLKRWVQAPRKEVDSNWIKTKSITLAGSRLMSVP